MFQHQTQIGLLNLVAPGIDEFSEIYNPLDMDMREALPCEKSLIKLFRNSNLSLRELEIAGVALIRHIYNDDYGYAL